MIGYKINGKIFYNPFLAFLDGAHHSPHEIPKFFIHDDIFKNINWTKEPEESLRDLIDLRARIITQKYEKIILCFSGGTDSVTAYNSFMRQNIFIDEIIITFTPKSEAHSVKNISWLLKNHKDKRTKITVFNRNDPKFRSCFDNEEWVLQNHGQFRDVFELTVPGGVYNHCNDSWGNKNWCMVIGYEKPHILREKNQWLAVHLDKVFAPGLNWPRIEFFFITTDLPQLHIKQNHSLLKYIKKKYNNFYEGWSSVKSLGKSSPIEYLEYAAACGCDKEINTGQGWTQKKIYMENKINDLDSLMGNHFYKIKNIDPLLKEKLIQKDPIAKSFINGWRSLENDSTLRNYMMRHKFLTNANQTIENYNGFWGQKYLLENN